MKCQISAQIFYIWPYVVYRQHINIYNRITLSEKRKSSYKEMFILQLDIFKNKKSFYLLLSLFIYLFLYLNIF